MTLAKSIAVLSIVGALIMAYFASGARISYEELMGVLYNETLEYKHERCYMPAYMVHEDPKKFTENLANVTIQRWFYDPFIRACRPFFTLANNTYSPRHKNYNLPRTRIECETLCGSICLVDHADGTTEMGICMSLEFGAGVPNSCAKVLPEAHPKQCPQLYSKCCPRSYWQLINTPVTSPTVGFPSRRQNRSSDDAAAATTRRRRRPYSGLYDSRPTSS